MSDTTSEVAQSPSNAVFHLEVAFVAIISQSDGSISCSIQDVTNTNQSLALRVARSMVGLWKTYSSLSPEGKEAITNIFAQEAIKAQIRDMPRSDSPPAPGVRQ